MHKLIVALSIVLAAPVANAALVCANGSVMGQAQQVCWFDEQVGGAGGEEGGGSGPGPGPGGNGNGGSGPGPGLPMIPTNLPGVTSNATAKNIRALGYGCGDEDGVRQQVVMQALVVKPFLPRHNVVTVRYPDDGTFERYTRVGAAGSWQFAVIPGQECGPVGG